ncbi:MAG: ANTAR domain-containing protein [Pseudonocardiaceae bacterium]|nr:ANTAR domain-containing protein [Pseudonocardiaceae bacterium]
MSATAEGREPVVAEALVSLADTLVDDYDVIELMHRLVGYCVELLAIDAAGLLLTDQRGDLHVVASSAEPAMTVEMFELEADEGPCLECFRTRSAVTAPTLREAAERWPRFTTRAEHAGFQSMYALPLRLRNETIGALNFFGTEPGPLPSSDLRLGQALADVATIGVLQERAIRQRTMLAEQLQSALNSRVIIEQAKGVLAERGNLDMTAAFNLLRSHARSTNQRLSDLAQGIVNRVISTGELLDTDDRSIG